MIVSVSEGVRVVHRDPLRGDIAPAQSSQVWARAEGDVRIKQKRMQRGSARRGRRRVGGTAMRDRHSHKRQKGNLLIEKLKCG